MNGTEYRIVALDMDGTLLNSRSEITEYSRDVIRRAAEAGKIVALATGRCFSELIGPLKAIPDVRYVMCENGACLYDMKEQRCLRQLTIPFEVLEEMILKLKDFDCLPQFFIRSQSYVGTVEGADLTKYRMDKFYNEFVKGSVFMPDLCEWFLRERPPMGKVCLYFTSKEDRAEYWSRIGDLPLTAARSLGIGLEICPAGMNKGTSLELLCGELGIDVAQSIGVGDSDNDLELMRKAGLSAAMGNANSRVKESADVITDDCDHDGAARVIEKYMLGGE